MTNKIKSFAICLLVAIAMVMGAFALNTASASGVFAVNNGAAIRIRNVDNTYGIQFTATVDTSVDATYNMMIVPESYVEYYDADNTQDKAPLAEWMLAKKAAHPEMPLAIVENITPNNEGVIKGSIVNVQYHNLNTKFIGAAYYEVAGEPVCADLATDGARTIVEVAELAIADPENADFTADLGGIVKDAINQANGKEAGSVDPITIAMDKTTADMYIGQELTLAYTPAIATSLASWSVEGDAVTVANGKVTAVKAGTATVSVEVMGATASCEVTVSNVQVHNANGVTVNAESATKGSVTFTSPAGSVQSNSSSIVIHGDFTDQFVKVEFTTGTTQIYDSASSTTCFLDMVGVGLRQSGNVSASALAYPFSYQYTQYGSVGLNVNGHMAYTSAASANAGSGAKLASDGWFRLAANTKYTIIAGVVDNEGGDQGFYWSIIKPDGNVKEAYYWNLDKMKNGAYNTYHGTGTAESGSIVINSWLTTERTVSYEVISKADAMAFFAEKAIAPTVTQDGAKLSWTAVGWADGYRYKIDDADWVETTDTSLSFETGIYNVQVKAYNDDFESKVASYNMFNLEDEVSFIGMQNVTSTELTHEKGNITYETNGAYRNGGALILKGNYTNELIKVGFTAPSQTTYAQTPNIEIGMRGTEDGIRLIKNSASADSVATFDFRFWNYSTASLTYSYTSLAYYTTNIHSDNAFAKVLYGSSVAFNKLTEGLKYYIVAGMVTEGGANTAYYGLFDANNKPITIVAFDVDGFAKANNLTVPESGWFNIYSYHASGTIEYEMVTLDELLFVSNSKQYDISKSNGVTTFTYTPNTLSNANYNQPGNVAAFGTYDYCTTEFIKVGFNATNTQLSLNYINIGLRTNRIASYAYDHMPCWNLRLFKFAEDNHQISLTYKAANNYASITGTCVDLTVGNKYYIVAGVVDGAEGAKTVYWALTEENGTVIDKKTWNYPPTNGTEAMADGGYYVVSAWYGPDDAPAERTFTYEILSQADGLAACGVNA